MGDHDTNVGDCVGKCCRQTNSYFINVYSHIFLQFECGIYCLNNEECLSYKFEDATCSLGNFLSKCQTTNGNPVLLENPLKNGL